MEVQMQNSLPARPSLEQLKKLAKDLVKDHAEKQPEAIALIARQLPSLAGKNAEQIAAYPFALHDAQSVVARQYGFRNWNELQAHVEKRPAEGPQSDLEIAAKLDIVFRSYEEKDYALFCSVMNEIMISVISRERFEGVADRLSGYIKADYQTTYMGGVHARGRTIYFWRLWVAGKDDDSLVRMALNEKGLISGLLFSDPFDTAAHSKK
jgi:hypothetical protein